MEIHLNYSRFHRSDCLKLAIWSANQVCIIHRQFKQSHRPKVYLLKSDEFMKWVDVSAFSQCVNR